MRAAVVLVNFLLSLPDARFHRRTGADQSPSGVCPGFDRDHGLERKNSSAPIPVEVYLWRGTELHVIHRRLTCRTHWPAQAGGRHRAGVGLVRALDAERRAARADATPVPPGVGAWASRSSGARRACPDHRDTGSRRGPGLGARGRSCSLDDRDGGARHRLAGRRTTNPTSGANACAMNPDHCGAIVEPAGDWRIQQWYRIPRQLAISQPASQLQAGAPDSETRIAASSAE